MKTAITQKAISLKIDLDLLPQLDQYCVDHNIKRNKAINQAVEKMVRGSL